MELIDEEIHIIAKEIEESNATQWTITKIIKELTQMKTTSEKKLREKAKELLKDLDPEAFQIYEAFSKMKVYTSKETIENFNRGNIIKSLLKETQLSRSVAEKITIEVENQIKDSKISFLTTSLIRELVNAKLIGYGFEEIRNKYTRLGEPLFEVRKKIEEEPYSNEQTRELTILSLLPKEIRKKHFDGTIYIEDLNGFATKPFTYTFIAEKKSSIESTVIKNIGKIINNSKYFSNTPNIMGLSFVSAPFIKNDNQSKKAVKLIKNMLKIPSGSFVNSLELFTPQKLSEFSEYKLKAAQLSNQLLDEEHSIIMVDSKYCLKLIEQKNKDFFILNNEKEEYYPMNNGLFSTSQGIDLFVNVNLEKIAIGTEETFFEKLEQISQNILKLKELKTLELSSKNYLKEFDISSMRTGIGLTNLFMVQRNFPEKKPIELANKIYKELSKNFEDCLLFGLGSETAKKKFEKVIGKEIFSQDILDFEECLNSKKCCFSGKAASIKEINELLDKKVKQIQYTPSKHQI